MVGGHAVAEDAEGARAFDFGDAAGLHFEVREERRLLDVGALAVPLIHVADSGRDLVPLRILRREVLVELLENLRLERRLHGVAHFLKRGPEVGEINGFAVLVLAERFAAQVNVHAARERERDDERRRHEEVCLDVLMHARLEVTVAREHAGGDEIVLHHGLLDVRVERAGVADARRAAVADEVEAELVEIGREAGLLEVIRDDARTGRERRLHGRVHLQTFFHGLLREQTGGDHHARIAGVRAARDGGDQHRAGADGGFLLRGHLDLHGFREVFARLAEAVLGHGTLERAEEFAAKVRQLDAVLRTLRASDAGLHRVQIELDDLRVIHLASLRNAPEILRLVVVLIHQAMRFAAAGGAQVVGAFLVDGEEAHRRAVFWSHVRDGRAVHERERGSAGSEELNELADDLRLAEQLRDGERDIGGGDAFTDRAGEMNAHNIRREEVNRLPEHARLRLDAAHAPADDAETIDHRGVRIRAHECVGIINVAGGEHALGEIFEVHLMHDADAGRDDLERVERLHAPLEELIALTVALKFDLQILGERIRRTGRIHLHRVIHHEVHRHERLDDLGVLAELRHGAAHRSEIHEQRDAGEVLQHDARDHERNLRRARLVRLPVREFLHVRLADLLFVVVAQHGFQHDADAHGQARDGADTGGFQRGKRVELA